MNFDEAIKAHIFWKVTLRWMINGQRPIDVMTVGADNYCELGRWIAGEGRNYRHLSGFDGFVREHAGFHRLAGEVVKMVQDGRAEEAVAMLAPDGEFTLASARTIEAIRVLQRQLEQE